MNTGDLVCVARKLGIGYTLDLRDIASTATFAYFCEDDVGLVLCTIQRTPAMWNDQALVLTECGVGRLSLNCLEVIS